MHNIDYVISLLENIVEKEIPFSIAVKNFSDKKASASDRKIILALTGASLRRYYLFDLLIQKHFQDLSKQATYALMAALSNYLFVKKLPQEDVLKYLSTTHQFSYDEVKEFLTSLKFESLIPEEIKKGSVDFLSIRYNVPSWLVKMWRKHFGENLLYRILKGISAYENVFALRNSYHLTDEEFLAKYQGFTKSKVDGLYLYENELSFKKSLAYLDKNAVRLKPAEKILFDALDIDPARGVAIYGECYNHFHLALAFRYSHLVTIDMMTPRNYSYYEYKKSIEYYSLKNVHLYEANASSMITCLSNPVHTLFVCPKNTNFALLRSSPDYFLRCKQENIDECINKQIESLLEASSLVEENGSLVYLVPTMNKKETHQVVFNFLKEHDEYQLVEEKQFLPIDSLQSVFYYAILKRVK